MKTPCNYIWAISPHRYSNPGSGVGKCSASNVTRARWQMQLIFLPSDAICQSGYLTHLNAGQTCLSVNIHKHVRQIQMREFHTILLFRRDLEMYLRDIGTEDICTCHSLETLLLGKFRKGPQSPSPRHWIHCILNCRAQIWSWFLNQYPNNFWTFNEIVSFVQHSCYPPLQLAEQIRNTYTHAHTYMYVFRHESTYRGQRSMLSVFYCSPPHI